MAICIFIGVGMQWLDLFEFLIEFVTYAFFSSFSFAIYLSKLHVIGKIETINELITPANINLIRKRDKYLREEQILDTVLLAAVGITLSVVFYTNAPRLVNRYRLWQENVNEREYEKKFKDRIETLQEIEKGFEQLDVDEKKVMVEQNLASEDSQGEHFL